MTTQVLTKKWTFETRPDDDPVWSHAVTGDATVERVYDRWELSLTATSEAQQARVDMAGNLLLDVGDLRTVRMLLDVGTIPAGVSAYWGLATANATAVDDIGTRVLFEAKASNDITVRVDDAVIDSGSVSTGWTADGKMIFVVDFANGIKHQVPAFQTKRGKDCLQFFSAPEGQSLRLLNRLDIGLEHYTFGLQPFFRIEKASGTATAKIKLHQVEVEYLA